MTTEFVLLLGLYVFILVGAFLGGKGPMATFKAAGPRLAAKVEQSIAVGNGPNGFQDKTRGQPTAYWSDPENQ